jgi:hypothetical protein
MAGSWQDDLNNYFSIFPEIFLAPFRKPARNKAKAAAGRRS